MALEQLTDTDLVGQLFELVLGGVDLREARRALDSAKLGQPAARDAKLGHIATAAGLQRIGARSRESPAAIVKGTHSLACRTRDAARAI